MCDCVSQIRCIPHRGARGQISSVPTAKARQPDWLWLARAEPAPRSRRSRRQARQPDWLWLARAMVLGAIGRIAHTHPIKFGMGFSCLKTSFSDWLVQSQVEKREHIDWRRNMTFAAFGFFYLGGVQYFLYVPVFSRLFPGAAAFAKAPLAAKLKDAAGQRSMVAQVVIDQFVHHPLLYFPVFYGLKEVVNGGTVGGGLAKYAKNYSEDLPALWKLWVPSTIINFSIMPMHLRIPWVASTSLIWTCIISYMRGGDDTEMDSDAAMSLAGNQGIALKALYDLGVSAKPAYMYDKTKSHLMVTATGRDRTGFIKQVAGNIASHRGNILDVKAYKVGREVSTRCKQQATGHHRQATTGRPPHAGHHRQATTGRVPPSSRLSQLQRATLRPPYPPAVTTSALSSGRAPLRECVPPSAVRHDHAHRVRSGREPLHRARHARRAGRASGRAAHAALALR